MIKPSLLRFSHRTSVVCALSICTSALCCTLFQTHAFASLPDKAYTGTAYASLRRQARCDTALSYARVQADPTLYRGKVIEIAGRVGGSSSDGVTLSIVVVLTDGNAVSVDLPASASEALSEDPTGRVRVLAEVGSTEISNTPPLKALGFVHEGDIRRLEQAEEAKTKAVKDAEERRREKEEKWKKEAERAVSVNRVPAAPILPPPPGGSDTVSLQNYLTPRARPLFWPYYRYIAKTNERLDAAMAGKITFHLLNFADHNNVDPRLVVAMIFAESHFDPNATSRSGAMGLGQLMPGTARSLGVDNPYDPIQNLGGSINYLRSRLDTFADHALPGGSVSFEQAALAMAAYNAGVNAVKRYNGIPPYTQTQNYVRKVISLYRQLCS